MPTYRLKLQVQGALEWRVDEEPGNAGWVGVCDTLGITVEGRTWREFTETANEAVENIVRTHLEEGTLVDFVRAHGLTLRPDLPVEVNPDEVDLDVPVDFQRVTDGDRGARCQ